MSKPASNYFLSNLADLTPEQATVVWRLGKAANVITADIPENVTGKALRDAVGTVETATKLNRIVGNAPGQEGIVQALYGKPGKVTPKVAENPVSARSATPVKGRPASGNNSGRYSNAAINPQFFVLVKCANPKRPGSQAYGRFAKYKNGATVNTNVNIEGGPRMDDLRWDLQRGHIEIVPSLPQKEGAETPKVKSASNGVSLATSA